MFMAMPAGVGRGVRGLGLGWVHERREGEGERDTKKKLWVQGLYCVHSKGVLASANCLRCKLKANKMGLKARSAEKRKAIPRVLYQMRSSGLQPVAEATLNYDKQKKIAL